MTYGAVVPDLFDAVVANHAPMLHLPEAASPRSKVFRSSGGGLRNVR
jgi:hypothetical protein